MTTYTIHHPAQSAPEILNRSDDVEFIKDGFCWPALFVPFIWLIYRRLWIALICYIGLLLLLSAVGAFLSLTDDATTLVGLGANILMGFEANNLRRWTVRRRGYRDVGVVIAKTRIDAEMRYFQYLIDAPAGLEPPVADPVTPAQKPVRMAVFGEKDEPVGLYPSPGSTA